MTTEQSTSPAAQGNQNGLATASLVTGIVGVVFAFLFSIVGLVLGVVATALGGTARTKGARDGRTTAGLVLGVVAIVVSVVMMVIAYNVLT
jgi:heme/copper-type cytochrome/quinol oxidase subunit 2